MTARRVAVVVLAALLLPILPASAGPLDPPQSRLRMWAVEFVGPKPAVQTGEVHITGYGPGPVVVAFIAFEIKRGKRDLFRGDGGSMFIGPDPIEGNYNYPSVYVDGHGTLTPACDTEFTCTQQPVLDMVQPTNHVFPLTREGAPIRRSYYVIALNAEISQITTSPGWRPAREISTRGLGVRVVGHAGTGVYTHGTTWEHFKGPLSAPGGRYGSIAYSVIPCMSGFGPFPEVRPGRARLHGGDPPPAINPSQRTMDCDANQWAAYGAATRATTWTLDGESFGWAMSPYRLAVMDLPRFP